MPLGGESRVESKATVKGRGGGGGEGEGKILTILVALQVAAIRSRLKQIAKGIALQPLSFYSLIPIISSLIISEKMFNFAVEVLFNRNLYAGRRIKFPFFIAACKV